MDAMTDQPKPTPQWSILCDESRGRPRCLIVDKDGNEVAAVNPYREDWNEVSELIACAPELLAEITELTADLRTAADQCEALSKNLADHKHQLDTMVEENRRLRHLLRQYKHRLDKRWREGTRMDAYARGYQDGLEAAEVIFDDVFNAIGPGE